MNTEDKIKLAIERGMTYNPITGNIYGVRGNLITTRHTSGYIFPGIRFEKKQYRFLGHTFAWYYTYGKMPNKCIDHINRIKDDNRISNLRDITYQQNSFNTKSKGYCWHNKAKKWISQIKVDGKLIYLGLFDTEIEAHQSYLEAKKLHHAIDIICWPI